jgi:SAM-dependent methyltransferase
VEANACALPFEDASFDRVLCIEAMFHFPSRQRFFQEVTRVLRPGGVFVASDIRLRTERIAALGISRAEVEAALPRGFGPWPDLWNREGDDEALASSAGLILTRRFDATAQTRPSQRFTAPPSLDPPDGDHHPMLVAAVMLRRLHEADGVSYDYLRFEKAG